MSFVELYDLLSNKLLKMTKLCLMDDINEGLGSALKLQDSSTFGFGFAFAGKEQFKDFHLSTQGRTYISCWTTEPDAMAMWLLYSKEKNAIRVKTTSSKLKKSLDEHFKKNIHLAHINSDEGTFQLDTPPVLEPVSYVDFEEVSNKIKIKYKAFYDELGNHDHTMFKENGLPNELQEILNRKTIEATSGALLKDKAYSHENEMRACFTGCLRNSLTAEEWEKNKGSDDARYVFSTATCHYPNTKDLPSIVKVPVEHNFIDEICFDPRMPEYMIQAYLEILQVNSKAVSVGQSKAFGYKLDSFDYSLDF